VPLAIAADDHQRYNARLLSDVDAAEVIPEAGFTAEGLAGVLSRLVTDPAGLARRAAAARSVAQPDAAERLADLVERTARP
jgi:UDP-N-acetylglucosamine--N-acetylmuramyl-(pentapeptide) pyrophosphoryl-undecaprenol N-acetylglucosamine transferase